MQINIALRAFISILLFSYTLNVSGTPSDSVSYYLQHYDLDNAKRYADKEVVKNKNSHFAWFQRGEVYNLFLKDQKKNISPEISDKFLNESYKSYVKATTLSLKSGKVNSTYISRLERCHSEILNAGSSNYLNQNYETAYQWFDKAIDITSLISKANRKIIFDTISIYYQALALEKNGNTEDAKRNYLKLVSMGYRNPELYVNLATIYKSAKDYNNAFSILQNGLRIFPLHKSLLVDLANLAIITNRQSETANDLKANVLKNKFSADLCFVLATLYDNMNFTLDAEAYYKKTVETDAGYIEADYNLAVMYYNLAMDKNKKLNDVDRSSELFKQILTERNTLLKKAEPLFKKAMIINPKEIQKILKNISNSLS